MGCAHRTDPLGLHSLVPIVTWHLAIVCPPHCGHLESSDWCRVATKLGVGLSLHLLHLGVVYGLHTLHRPYRSNLLGR